MWISTAVAMFTAIACADSSPGSDPASPEATSSEHIERGDDDVVIRETTQGKLGGESVGVGNMWEREYELPGGESRTDLTARLYLDDGETLVVGRGSVVEIGDERFEIVDISKPESGHGQVRFRPLEPTS